MTYQHILADQREFFLSQQTKPYSFRIKQLKKFKKALEDNEKYFYEAIYNDFGKSNFETYVTELGLIYSEIDLALKKLRTWMKPIKKKTSRALLPGKSFILPEPYGNCLVIGAWNYPIQLSLMPAVSAMAAGNTLIIKPSEIAKETSAVMAKVLNRIFLPEVLHVIEGGVQETQELLSLNFDKIFFTGSVPVGKIVYKAAAENLTPVTLELGGKSPTFVLKDANIKMTAKRIVWGKFLNAGQTCVATDYILVHNSVEKELLEEIRKQIDLQFPDFDSLPENYTQIINEKNFNRLTSLIDSDKVIKGGTFDKDNRIIHPTVMKDIQFADPIMDDEIFGPILPVIAFDNLDDVIQDVKHRAKPLALYVFSKNTSEIDKIHSEISFGGGCVNDTVIHFANPNVPLGGVGSSGIGNYHAYAGFQAFSHFKGILKKPYWFEPKMKYAPYTDKKLRLIKKLLM